MHLASMILIVLGAWLLLAVPIALLLGRFLRAADRLTPTEARPASQSFDSAA